MKKHKWLGICLAVATTMSLFTGCGNANENATDSTGTTDVSDTSATDTSATDTSTTDTSAEYKDEIHIALNEAPATLDVMMGTDSIPRIITYGNVYESLVTLTSDYNWKEELAEKVEINDDYTQYTYYLRKGVKFHDGTEMTADDVVASMNRWIGKYSNAKIMVGDARFEKVDDYTVTIKTEQPALFLNELIATQSQGSVIMPKTVIDSVDESTGVTEYIGTGPYKYVEWKDGQYVKLERFEDYQPYGTEGESDGWWTYKTAPTSTIYFDFVTDASTRVAGITTGEYDFAYALPIDNYNQFSDTGSFQTFKDVRGCFSLVYNKTEGLSSDILIRQAINAAVNPEEILIGAFGNEEFFRIETSYMGSEMPNWYTTAGEENAFKNDAELAKKYLTEAGYNGETFRILVKSSSPELVNAAVVVEQELEKIGMNVDIITTDNSTYQTYRNDPTQYDMFFGTTMPVPVPTTQLFLGAKWTSGLSDTVILDGVEEINRCTSLDEAKSKWNELQKYCWTESLPITKLATYFNYSVASTKVDNIEYFSGPLIGNAKVKK